MGLLLIILFEVFLSSDQLILAVLLISRLHTQQGISLLNFVRALKRLEQSDCKLSEILVIDKYVR